MCNAWNNEQTARGPLIYRRNPLLWKEVQLSALLFNKGVKCLLESLHTVLRCIQVNVVQILCKIKLSYFQRFMMMCVINILVLWWCDVLPEGLVKSRTLAAGCSRSGLLDDRLPGMGIMATLCRHCLVPTILSSWDWDKPLSLRTQREMDYIQHKH